MGVDGAAAVVGVVVVPSGTASAGGSPEPQARSDARKGYDQYAEQELNVGYVIGSLRLLLDSGNVSMGIRAGKSAKPVAKVFCRRAF